jgi:hypothetical protein
MRTASVILLVALIASCVAASPARAQDAAAPGDKPAAEGAAVADAPKTSAAPALPRRARWQRMEVAYLAANVRHPALYGDSMQEKVKHDDAAHNNVHGWAFAMAWEYVQWPAQVLLTPVAVALKPPWTMESKAP